MTAWMLATLALLPPLAMSVVAAGRGNTGTRLVAAQMASAVTLPLLTVMTFAFDQPSLIDLALAAALLSLPGTLLLALFLERWL